MDWAEVRYAGPGIGAACAHGNPIDNDYIDKVNYEAEVGYDLGDLAPARIGRPSPSEAGDSPQVRFRCSASAEIRPSPAAQQR
ncbi:MAG: hypothetical protein ACRDTA_05845 [Pseudonocardiaceae bacterium]